MAALELALDVAYHDGSLYDLAVASEAYKLAGYHDGATSAITHATRDEIEHAIAFARYRRKRKLLLSRAQGMLDGLQLLADQGVITWANCSEANRQRWLARGGHDRGRAA